MFALASTANAQVAYRALDLGTLGSGTSSAAHGINNAGQVVGAADPGGFRIPMRAVVWNGTTITDLGALVRQSSANGINDAGQIVGSAFFGGDPSDHAALWNGPVPTDLGTLGGSYSGAKAINNAGQVVGSSLTAPFPSILYSEQRATVWNGTVATNLGTLGGRYSIANGINNAGQIVGNSYTSGDAATHATLWNGTVATDLGTLGGKNSGAEDINDLGQVVGYAERSGSDLLRATLWNGTVATDLGTLGGTYSLAHAINNSGQVVGSAQPVILDPYNPGATGSRATLWNGTVATDLNTAEGIGEGWVLITATGINDNGWIAANGQNTVTGAYHAFLLTPVVVPEPGSYAMMLSGLGIIGLWFRRRRRASA